MSDGKGRAPPDSARAGAVAIVAARAAATVVLARDHGHEGLQLFLVQRAGSMGFMGGMYVFPGGKVADGDASPRARARIRAQTTDSRHGLWGAEIPADQAVALAVGAIRETFEEAGVLLAEAAGPAELDALRTRLLGGADFASLLEGAGLWLELGLLEPFARWITPESEPVRFDTAFYLARSPADQKASHDEHESIAGAWFSPTSALAAAAEQRIRLAPPTERTIEWLSSAQSVDDAMRAARSRPPPTILPVIRRIDDQLMVLLPGDPEHPVRTPAFPGPTRSPIRRR